MKVKLLKDIKRFGSKGSIHEVSDGYASSYLIPQGMACHANETDLAKYQEVQNKQANIHNKQAREERELFARVNKHKLNISRGTNGSGKLFESIKAADICEHIPGLTPNHIQLKRPIKEVGEYTIAIKVGKHKGSITVLVQAQ